MNKLKKLFILIHAYARFFVLNLLGRRPVRAYYWRGHKNFGDLLTPALLRYYGFEPVFFPPEKSQIVAVGSLIEHLNSEYKGIILGTGAIDKKTDMQIPLAKIIALRGKKTKELLKISSDITLGDPGLLANKLLNKRSEKKYRLGLIPHYSDLGNPLLQQIKNKNPNNVRIINVENEVIKVLKEIDECEFILSSSLHGLICSDSLGIPNRWIKLSTLLGGSFKFTDYYSVFDIIPKPLELTGEENLDDMLAFTALVEKLKIVEVQSELEQEFKSIFKRNND